jgi:tRNA (guanine37-N1)-methyltransferase
MINFDVITIFPEIFQSYLSEGLIARALKKKLLKVQVHNLRKWTKDKHKTVDDRPFGGGLGMILKIEPIYKSVQFLKSQSPKKTKKKVKVILFTPRGKQFNQKMAYQFSKLDQLILICGRYEGVDERVAKHIADIELSIGNYVLMGGELPAMVVVEAVARLIPGVIGKPRLLKERIPSVRGRGGRGFIEYPQYTRPEIFEPKKGVKWRAPKVLLSGDHKKIEEWKNKHGKIIEK